MFAMVRALGAQMEALLAGALDKDVQRNMRIEVISSVAYGIFYACIIPFIPVVLRRAGATPEMIALYASLQFLGSLTTSLSLVLMRRRRTFNVIITFWLLARSLFLITALVQGSLPLIALGSLYWLLEGFVIPGYTRIVQKLYPDDVRGKVMSTVRMGQVAAVLLITPLAGWALDHIGYRTLFPVASLIGIASVLLFMRMRLDEGPLPPRQTKALTELVQIVRNDRRFGIYLVSFALLGVGTMLSWPLYPLVQVDRLGLSYSQIGLLGLVESSSPFNIVEQLQIPYFTFAEVQELIDQHRQETGQVFTPEVIQAIYNNTQGQPGLVNGLCQYLVDVMTPDRTQPVTMSALYPTLKHFLTERFDKNILNVVQKARTKKAFMVKLLFGEAAIPFTVNDPDIAYLYANGVVDNVDGYVQLPAPLYSKALITAFRPHSNGETQEYVSAHDTFRDYVTADGLNLHAILQRYREYVQRRGFHAFDTEQLKEAAWHYSLDGFINFFIQQLGGDTLVEVPSGRGRTDILILYRDYRYIIETKVFLSQTQYQHGKQQLADYLTTEGLQEGFYVVFSQKHTAAAPLFFDELIIGKRIRTISSAPILRRQAPSLWSMTTPNAQRRAKRLERCSMPIPPSVSLPSFYKATSWMIEGRWEFPSAKFLAKVIREI